MRPLKLEISAFCSYSGRTVIDMEKLGENGIYLITGDTGAGKTTIFDAITYALYGTPSGSNRDPSMLRSMYAPVHISTYVRLAFSHKGEVYLIERNPTHTRAKKEGGKPATVNANAELYKVTDGEEKNIASGTTKVNEAVIGILGIDHKQFCHIAMIAQGDFVKLLTARSDERQRIFRKLFDTQMYDSIQNILKEKETAAKKEYELIKSGIRQNIAGASCDENSPLYEEFCTACRNEDAPQEALELIKKITEEDSGLNTFLEEKIKDINSQITTLSKAQSEANNIINTKNALALRQNELNAKNELSLNLKKLLEEQNGKTSEAEKLGQEIADIKAFLSDYSIREAERRKLSEATNNLNEDKKILEQSIEKRSTSKARTDELSEELRKLENAGEQRARLELSKAEAATRMNGITELQSVIAQLEKLTAEREKTEEKYRLSRENASAAETQYTLIRNAFLDAQAGFIARTLEDGVPCRVCGSVHHPSPAQMPDDAPTQEQLEKAEEGMKNAREAQERVSKEAAEIKEKCESREARITGLAKQLGITAEMHSVKSDAQTAMKETQQFMAQLDRDICEEDSRIARKKELSSLSEEIRKEETALQELVSELEKRIAAGEIQIKAHNQNISALSEKLLYPSLAEAETAVAEKLKIKQDIENAINEAQTNYSSCEKDIANLKGGIAELEAVLQNSGDVDTEKNYDELISELNLQRDRLQENKDNVNSRLAINSEAVRKTEKLLNTIAPVIKKCECLANLNDAVRGNISGQDKLSLEAYVQAVYFERIIAYANMRLDVMTGGQYALKRKQTGSSKSAKCGLDLEITDYFNGTVRDVGSLSGGESFKASLALALGLADEIQSRTGGVKLDTMFIDEGFGSLDESSLDQAMEALAQLGGTNRLVGIISHVSELKRRIDKKIIVTKTKPAGENDSYGTEVKITV